MNFNTLESKWFQVTFDSTLKCYTDYDKTFAFLPGEDEWDTVFAKITNNNNTLKLMPLSNDNISYLEKLRIKYDTTKIKL